MSGNTERGRMACTHYEAARSPTDKAGNGNRPSPTRLGSQLALAYIRPADARQRACIVQIPSKQATSPHLR